jgi:TonB family protein
MRDRVRKAVTFAACFCLCAYAFYLTVQAQDPVVQSSVPAMSPSGNWQRDKLKGKVRRLRVETAKILVKEGKPVEGPRVLRELSTYDPNGVKIDSVTYPAEGAALVGKPQYQYDSKGNIVEMILHGDGNSIVSREVYQYEFDEFENWKKMTTLTTVIENGNIGYEPVEITYRTITYYYGSAVSKVSTAVPAPTAPIKNPVPAVSKAANGPIRPIASSVNPDPLNVSPAKPERASSEAATVNVVIPKPSTSEEKTAAQVAAARAPAGESSGQKAYTPGLGSGERKAILTALRASVGRDIQKPMIFRVGTLVVRNGLAELSATPLQPNLQPFDYRNTPYEKCMAAGECSDSFTAVLRKQDSAWMVVKYAFGSRDVTNTRNADQAKSEKTGTRESPPAAAAGASVRESEQRNADQAESEKATAKNSPKEVAASASVPESERRNDDNAKVALETNSPNPTAAITTPAVTTPVDPSKPAVINLSEKALRSAAIKLPQPEYPKAAVSAQAEGNVEVQILVNEKGEVMNARAVSGDPLLGEAAESAARRARFRGAKLSAKPARIYGVINYTFIRPRQKSATAPPASALSSGSPVTTPVDPSKPAVINLSEEALRAAAIELPQPAYPQAAIAAQAEGNVEVQILVNEKGEVMNARAVSGDALLGEAAEAAARRARFTGAKLSAKPARIYGVINYTFVRPDQTSATAPSPSDLSSSPPVTTPVEPSNLAVIQVSEEALRAAAIELPQPDYPQAAISAQLEGAVEVQVLVNEKGEVLNARAVSGNPVLGAAAEAAARRARFTGTKLSAEPAKIYGVINYVFIRPDHTPVSASPVNDDSSEPTTATPEETRTSESVKKQAGSNSNPPAGALPSARFLYAKGLSLLGSQRYDEAVQALKQAVQLDPNDATAYLKLGLAHSALSQYQEAVVVLNMGIRIKPEVADAETYYHLGNAYIALGKNSEGLESLKQAKRLMKAASGDSEAANVAGSPSVPALHYITGLAYYNLRRYSNAIDELKKATALDPTSVKAVYGLALSYVASGDLKSAEKQRKILTPLDPVLAEKVGSLLSTTSSPQGLRFVFKDVKP